MQEQEITVSEGITFTTGELIENIREIRAELNLKIADLQTKYNAIAERYGPDGIAKSRGYNSAADMYRSTLSGLAGGLIGVGVGAILVKLNHNFESTAGLMTVLGSTSGGFYIGHYVSEVYGSIARKLNKK